MKTKYKMKPDLPAAACGRCMWFELGNDQGDGRCLVHKEYRYYKCMVCDEYDLDTDINY